MLGLTPGHGGIVPVDSEPAVSLVLIAAGLLVGIPSLRRLTPPGTLTARPILPAAVLLRGVMTFTFFGVDAYATLTLESWRGLSAVAAGVVLTAATISWTAGSWIQARVRRPLVVGAVRAGRPDRHRGRPDLVLARSSRRPCRSPWRCRPSRWPASGWAWATRRSR